MYILVCASTLYLRYTIQVLYSSACQPVAREPNLALAQNLCCACKSRKYSKELALETM